MLALQVKKIDDIRRHYEKLLTSDDDFARQSGTAMWIIDRLALRVGGEKDEDEADTVGCCSLRVEHIAFPGDNQVSVEPVLFVLSVITVWIRRLLSERQRVSCMLLMCAFVRLCASVRVQVTLDFLGKDSMRYHQTIDFERYGHIGKLVRRNLQRFADKKKPGEDIFDYLTVSHQDARCIMHDTA